MTVARCFAAGVLTLVIVLFCRQSALAAEQLSLAGLATPSVRQSNFCPTDVSQSACDAEYLALELSGQLLPPTDLYQQLEQDLAAIRLHSPHMSLIAHFPPWVAGKLTVGLTPAAWAEFVAGTYAEFETLDEEYRPVSIDQVDALQTLYLGFAQRFNPDALAPMYEALNGVSFATPDGTVGDGNTIRVSQESAIYSFDLKWGSCASGCIHTYTWEYAVSTDGSVTPLNHETSTILQAGVPARLTTQAAVTMTFPSGSVLHTTIVTATTRFTPTIKANEFLYIGRSLHTGVIEATEATLAGADTRLSGASRVATSTHLFEQPFTLTMTYADVDWQSRGITNESDLNVYISKSGRWVGMLPCAGCTFDTQENVITIVTDEMADFALMKRIQWSLFMPSILGQ